MIQIKNIAGDILYTSETAKTIREAVEEAVRKGISLKKADLGYADLRGAYLVGAYLQKANLYRANLSEADLQKAYLQGADLSEADLQRDNLCGAFLDNATMWKADLYSAYLGYANLLRANLVKTNLTKANLSNACLCRTNLRGANLQDSDLRGAFLNNTDFIGAENVPYIPLACPSNGAFIGWKKVRNYLIKLSIPASAKRSSATSNKCRCNKAKVLKITDLSNGKSVSQIINYAYLPSTTYEVGKMVSPDSFNDDRWNECSHGIHFFVNKEDAINYEL